MAQRELTSKIKEWLDTPADNRDILAGAELLLRINRNQIFFRNVARNPSAKAARLEYELRKIYNDRLQDFNHEEVVSLMAQVEQINRSRGLDKQPDTSRSDFQRGKRADHEELPQDIQQLWVQNADIMKKMRDCHTHLRLISTDNSSCPDSDRYPWAKEIVRLDTLLRDNYNKYDHYIRGSSAVTAQVVEDPRSVSKKCARLINMQKGRYAQSQSPELADKIREWYTQVINPSEKMTAELHDLGII